MKKRRSLKVMIHVAGQDRSWRWRQWYVRLIRLALPGSYCAAVHLLVRTPDKPKSSTNFGPAPCVSLAMEETGSPFVHVADYAAAVASSIHSAVKGAAFNITAEPVRNGDYLDRLAQLLECASAAT